MSENSTQLPILRDNGVPLVPRRAPHRPLAPSQALTQMQEQRVKAIVEKQTAELKARIERLEAFIHKLNSGENLVSSKPPKEEPAKPSEPPKASASAPENKSVTLPTATAAISDDAQKIIDRAKNPDLKRALTAIAKKDVPDDVKLKQMAAALKKHEPES